MFENFIHIAMGVCLALIVVLHTCLFIWGPQKVDDFISKILNINIQKGGKK